MAILKKIAKAVGIDLDEALKPAAQPLDQIAQKPASL